MYKIFVILFPLLTGVYSLVPVPNQKNFPSGVTTCHTVPGDEGMAALAALPGFQALHLSPLPLIYQTEGAMIDFPAPDGIAAKAYQVKAASHTDKWLFVYQEWWGVNDYVKRQADILFKELGGKVNVLALDMYDGKVTSNPQEAGQWVRAVVETRLENIIKGATAYVGGDALIASLGWCFGGGWSLKSALICGKQNIGSVMYYGMPVKDLGKLKTLNSDVLGLFATEEYISKAIIEEFASNMKTAGKKLDYKIFEAAHGFANPSNPRHDVAKSEEANAMALHYLKEKFKL